MRETDMLDFVMVKGLKGDDEWSPLFGGASTFLNGAVIILVEDRFDCGRVDVLAPIAPDERGTRIPVSREPAPVNLPKSASKKEFQEAMKSQSDAILAVYEKARIDIVSGRSITIVKR